MYYGNYETYSYQQAGTQPTSLQGYVSQLSSMQGQVQSSAPELMNLFNHLVSRGNALVASSTTSQSDIQAYGQAVKNFSTVLNAPDTELQTELEDLGTNIVQFGLQPLANIGNAVSNVTQGINNIGQSFGTVTQWLPYIALGGMGLFVLIMLMRNRRNG